MVIEAIRVLLLVLLLWGVTRALEFFTQMWREV